MRACYHLFRMSKSKANQNSLLNLIKTVQKLRAPKGCPWDRAQTHQSLRQYLIEETYEVIDVLDQLDSQKKLKNKTLRNAFLEELGDLLMQVLLHAEMAQEQKAFNIFEVAKCLDEKLIRRHPHVFGTAKAKNEDEAFQNWEKQKAKEKKPQTSILAGLPKHLPSLQKASRIIEKVTKVGFQWKDLKGPLKKVDEELRELKKELLTKANTSRIEAEFGDLLFTLCNLASFLKIDPEAALRGTLKKFEKRFSFVEKKLTVLGKKPEDSNLKEMDRYWNEAKSYVG